MARTGPTTLALPPFEGATRQLVLFCLGVFFVEAILSWVLPAHMFGMVFGHLGLVPWQLFHGAIWQLFTYSFLPMDILGELFTLLFLWFIGSMLEEARGSQWLYELFFSGAIGGGLLASLISLTHVLSLSPLSEGAGLYAAIYALLIAIYVLMGDREFLFFFVIRIKAKYMVAIYILIDTARLLLHSASFDALLHLSGALCGFLFLKYIPRRGFSYLLTERYYGMRNEYYRAKRRNAAKKFEVYMRKQNRDVHFDSNGKYVDPDDKDPQDKRWMN